MRKFDKWEKDLVKSFKEGSGVDGLVWSYRHYFRRTSGELIPPRERRRLIEQIIRDWMK